jgi:hypothetical protein
MTADEWTEAFTRELGLSPPNHEEVRAILELTGRRALVRTYGRARSGLARRGQRQTAR